MKNCQINPSTPFCSDLLTGSLCVAMFTLRAGCLSKPVLSGLTGAAPVFQSIHRSIRVRGLKPHTLSRGKRQGVGDNPCLFNENRRTVRNAAWARDGELFSSIPTGRTESQRYVYAQGFLSRTGEDTRRIQIHLGKDRDDIDSNYQF